MQQDVLDELGNGYQYVTESHAQKLIHKSVCEGRDSCVTVGVQPCVADYYNGARYILASQIPLPENLTLAEESQYVDSATTFRYWIVDKKTDKLYGPMGHGAFLTKKKSLGITNKKKLEVHPAGRGL